MTRHQFITKTKPFLNCLAVVCGISSHSTSVYEVLPDASGRIVGYSEFIV
jgi:hypothetical protein